MASKLKKADFEQLYTDDSVSRPGPNLSTVGELGAITVPAPQEFNLDDYVGYTFRGKVIADLDQVVDQIWTGRTDTVNGGTITFSFAELNHLTGLFNNPTLGFTADDFVTPFSEEQRDAARDAIGYWDDLIAPTFVEKNGRGADIVFSNSQDPAQAYAYYPGSQGYKFQSDIFIADPDVNWTNNWLNFNGYGLTTLVHELGHTLGLSHPGAYNGAGATTYLDQAEYAQDSEQYTIMSYWSPGETGAYILDWSTFLFGNAQTPMLHDILAIQAAYGADPTTRSGDTVYGFNSTAGRDVFDFSLNPYPNVAIYDAGGIDTIDLSGFNAGVHIDLHAGSFSSAGQAGPDAATVNANRTELNEIAGNQFGSLTQAQVTATLASYTNTISANIAADTGVGGVMATEYMNISIAYGTVIENAIGGSQRDVLWGNEVSNLLEGRGGNDVLNGFEGADTLVGGAGADTFQFTNFGTADVIADFQSGVDNIDLRAFGFTFVGNAAFTGTAGELRFTGDMLAGDYDGDGVADLIVTVLGDDVQAVDLIL